MPRRLADTLRDVLAGFAIADGEIHAIGSGSVNKHWRITSTDAVYALRRYNLRRSAAAIAYEHAVLRRAAHQGWPVAAPIVTPGGETTVAVDGRHFALFPFLPGRPAPYGNLRYLRVKGGLLARLHQDLSDDLPAAQRDGFGRRWELDPYVCDERISSFDELLEAFMREHPTLARAVRAERARSLEECAGSARPDLPDTIVHCDFHHDNILFSRGRLTGLLDFDLVRRDTRVVDIACSLALDCLLPPDYDTVDPEAAHAFVAGYAAESDLGADEVALVVPLIRASFLWLVAFRLTQWATGPAERPRRSVERSVHRRFPGLERTAEAITASVRAAVGAAR